MKNIKSMMVGLLVMTALAGCSTIEFTNGSAAAVGTESYDYWHHNVAFSLYELSQPVGLDNCQNGTWSALTVEKSFISAVAGSADMFIGFDAWDPWAVALDC